MKNLITFALVLGLAACSKSGSGGAAGEPCESSIGKAIDAMMASRKGSPEMMEQMKTIGEQLRGIMIGACKADGWSADVLGCFQTATDQPSIKKCREKLPPEQAQRLQAQILKVMSAGGGRPGGGGGPMHGTPPTGSGSSAPQ
ncbi:MAG: hypothetical protein H0T46_07460 [Deltaproteobacteria bacterium]|nr:hypothetical protein [Deltaproteobacteria bacterium]